MQVDNRILIEAIMSYIYGNNLEATISEKLMYKDKFKYKVKRTSWYDKDWIPIVDDGSEDFHVGHPIFVYDATRIYHYKVQNTFLKLKVELGEHKFDNKIKGVKNNSFQPINLYLLEKDMLKNPNLIEMVCIACKINVKKLLEDKLINMKSEEVELQEKLKSYYDGIKSFKYRKKRNGCSTTRYRF